jgi:hypothetical protein
MKEAVVLPARQRAAAISTTAAEASREAGER